VGNSQVRTTSSVTPKVSAMPVETEACLHTSQINALATETSLFVTLGKQVLVK
jgi:hypothetical protein